MTPKITHSAIDISRRSFGIGALSAAAGLTIGFRWASAQAPQGGPPVPPMIRTNPQLDAWVRIAPDGSVTVMTGRVEIGQGMLTVMRQVAADELDVAPERLVLISGDTAQTPNEGTTAGSLAVKLGSTALGLACADARATLVGVAAAAWNVPPAAIKVEDGQMTGPGGQRMSYGEAAGNISLSRPVDVTAKRKAPADQKLIGTSYPRVDIPAKVFGQQVFIHDLRPDGMLFGAIARPPAYAGRLVAADLAGIRAMPGVVEVVRDGSFLGVVARREEQAQAAANALAKSASWDAGVPLFGGKGVFDYMLTAADTETSVLHSAKGDAPPAAATHHAEYRRHFQAHASIGASCALAEWKDGRLTVWSHTQGPFPLRADLAKALKVPQGTIRVIHAQGSGCYGHNGADDVALDAALLARAVPGRPVRVHWAHEEEMAWEPWGPAMITRLTAGVSAAGALTAWTHDVWSFPHSTRPGSGSGCDLRSAWYLADPVGPSKATEIPLPTGGGGRNAVPIYAAPNQTITLHFLPVMPIRTSALRTLGGYFNAVSADMFLDELAAMSGRDPVAFRLANIRDPRLEAVLKRAVEMSGWRPAVVARRPIEPDMVGTGVGLSRYKNSDAYVAVVAEVSVSTRTGAVRVLRLWSATDVGRAVNPDGVLNQVDGGMAQAVSWTVQEAGRWDGGLMKAIDYASYPIQDFASTPAMSSVVIDRPDQPPLGAGEGSQAPAGAAIANAVFAAIGRRVPEIPLTPERVLAALAT
jgi:nicotinate dehydrogenase subunit B